MSLSLPIVDYKSMLNDNKIKKIILLFETFEIKNLYSFLVEL